LSETRVIRTIDQDDFQWGNVRDSYRTNCRRKAFTCSSGEERYACIPRYQVKSFKGRSDLRNGPERETLRYAFRLKLPEQCWMCAVCTIRYYRLPSELLDARNGHFRKAAFGRNNRDPVVFG